MQKMVLALASIAVLFSGTAAARELTASEKKGHRRVCETEAERSG